MISMSEKNVSAKAALIALSSQGTEGVLHLAKALQIGPSRLIGMLSELRDQGLIQVQNERTGRAGRPKKKIKATKLGMEYLVAYDALMQKPLKSRRADLRKAAADAEYARRLASGGLSIYDLFLELTTIVNNARGPAV